MTVVVIEKPAAIVALAEAKQHLGIDFADDDAMIEGFIAAATGWIDGPRGWLGRALGVQTLEYAGWCGSRRIALPYPEVLEIVEVVSEDDAGADVIADAGSYKLQHGCLVVADGAPWVTMRNPRIRYRAGYAVRDSGDPTKWLDDVPEQIKVAILFLVAQWYGNREAVVVGETPAALPFAVDALLQPFRVYR